MKHSQELLSLCNPQGEIIGTAPRYEVHEKGLLHASVIVALRDNQGRWLWQRRSWAQDTSPGLWDISVAGHLRPSESPLECAKREIKEELQMDLSDDHLQLFATIPFESITLNTIDREIQWCYIASLPQHMKPVEDQLEVLETCWRSIDEARFLSKVPHPELWNLLKELEQPTVSLQH
jgi:isopentenyl-diphosphate delta-isomerase